MITFDGEPVPVEPGQTIGAALYAAGRRGWRTTRVNGRPRGLFCGMGVCFDCLVTVNGQPDVRACLRVAEPGDVVTSAPDYDAPDYDTPQIPAAATHRTAECDVAVVGGGPAGQQAALAAAGAGCRVALVYTAPRPGYPVPADLGQLVEVLPGATVWAAQAAAERTRLYLTGAGVSIVEARAVVVATGGYDLPLPFPGWDLPGVLTAGGIQALLKRGGVSPGRRVALSGTGPFLLPVAAAVAEAGVDVVGVFEAGRPVRWLGQLPAIAGQPARLVEAARYLRVLRRHRIPFHSGHAVVAAHGQDRVAAATVARLRPDWTVVPGSQRRIEVDALGIGYGFVPVLDLALALGATGTPEGIRVDAWQRTTAPRVYAAGETTGIGGAPLAAAEGRLAGLAAAVDLGRLDEAAARVRGRAARRQRARSRRFAAALGRVYGRGLGLAWSTPDTPICRCEEVPRARIEWLVTALGATELRAVKLLSRAGMGMCQGRICGPAVTALLRAHLGEQVPDPLSYATRPLAVPVPLADLGRVEPA
ncbi:MAG: (2Fe-2S)-binding protein [Micromonosporaceae bacterium]|nr:(2Fe-2S)-binding protein [Micromonosporaceae bacterium]